MLIVLKLGLLACGCLGMLHVEQRGWALQAAVDTVELWHRPTRLWEDLRSGWRQRWCGDF
jgi:hypothetical protein